MIKRTLTHQYANNAKKKPEYKYIYKTIILNEQDLKFHTKVIKEENEKNKENTDTHSKDYDTIRKLVKDRETKENNEIISNVYYINGCNNWELT